MNASVFPIFSILLLSVAIGSSAMAEDRINVTSSPYNAVPNDGIDDTAQIMAAINFGTTASKSIYFPPGTYNFNGLMTLQPNKSYRIYGEGPGVSTIVFSTDAGHPTAGIYAPTMGVSTLNVDGLTLQANSANCGTAIFASFSESTPTKFRTAHIHNLQIIGSDRSGASPGYWTRGIHLYQAQNSVIDKLAIHGNIRTAQYMDDDATLIGITWESSTTYATTGLQLSNLEISFANTALKTNGWVENLFLTGFEFVQCGQHGMPAIDLRALDYPQAAKPRFHLFNGHVDVVQNAIVARNLNDLKISKVLFLHNGGAERDGTIVSLIDCFDATVSQCSFVGGLGDHVTCQDPPPPKPAPSPTPCLIPLTNVTGIRLTNADSVQIVGNYFTQFSPTAAPFIGIGIAIDSNSSPVRIIDNLFETTGGFGGVSQPYDDVNHTAYYHGNNIEP